jgi:hypothetical protein
MLQGGMGIPFGKHSTILSLDVETASWPKVVFANMAMKNQKTGVSPEDEGSVLLG